MQRHYTQKRIIVFFWVTTYLETNNTFRSNGMNLLSNSGDNSKILREISGQDPCDSVGIQVFQLTQFCNKKKHFFREIGIYLLIVCVIIISRKNNYKYIFIFKLISTIWIEALLENLLNSFFSCLQSMFSPCFTIVRPQNDYFTFFVSKGSKVGNFDDHRPK